MSRPTGPAAEPSWWSRRFTGALEAGAESGRLARGHDLAVRGAVRDLKVVPGEVRARVQGTRASPYRVSVIRLCLEDEDWDRLLAALGGQPLFRARLLAGELPTEVDRVFDVLGLHLFPRGLGDLVLTCSCPDRGDPCKHAAATLLALSDAVARDPFLLMTWLGKARGEFLAGLRLHASSSPGDGDEGAFEDAPRPRVEPYPALPEDPARFWAEIPLPEPPPARRPQPALYTADPPDGDTALLDALEPLYTRMTAPSHEEGRRPPGTGL